MELKRLFFAIEIRAPWPDQLPSGRLIAEENRHLTLAFLGSVDYSVLQPLLTEFPQPPFSLALAGFFDKPLFLSSVAAWHIHWLEERSAFLQYQKELVAWLKFKGFKLDSREFLSHVTLARTPFVVSEWESSFHRLPLYAKNIQLLESLGSSRYQMLWNLPLLAPFDEIEHTADIGFIVRGTSLMQLCLHAQLALSFHFPPLIPYFNHSVVSHLDDIIRLLNAMIAEVDTEIGCPFKAVSFHGSVSSGTLLEWEMIVDV